MTTGGQPTAKQVLRARLLAARRTLDGQARREAAERVTASVLALPELTGARTVAAYHSFGTEPPTSAVMITLTLRGVTILLPVLGPDNDLSWAIYDESAPPPADAPRLWTPPGPWLDPSAIASADVVLVPALAVGADGTRLGRGGGSYDRALARVPADRPVVALLHDGELLPEVPAEPHDRRVTVAVLPSAVHRFGEALR